jgi:hypothetical protein
MHEQRRHIPGALARPGRCKLAGQRRCSALCGTDACCRSRPAGSAACYWHACASSWAPARVRERSPNATRTRLDDERQEGQPRAGERGVARQQVARGQQRPGVQLVGVVEVRHRARGGHAARHRARVAPARAGWAVSIPKSAFSFLIMPQLTARQRAGLSAKGGAGSLPGSVGRHSCFGGGLSRQPCLTSQCRRRRLGRTGEVVKRARQL